MRMRATFKSLPEDPTELRAVSELMAAEIKAQAYQIEKLKKELAGHRKARFGSKSETMDQLAFDLQEDTEIAAASEAQKTAPKLIPIQTLQPNEPTIAHRCPIILSDRRKFCRRVTPAAIAVVRSSSSART